MPLTHPIFKEISTLADERGVRACVIGGYVRDHYLHRPSTDIDVVLERDAVEFAGELARGETALGLQHEAQLVGECYNYNESGLVFSVTTFISDRKTRRRKEKEREEGALSLFRSYKGLPKNNPFSNL